MKIDHFADSVVCSHLLKNAPRESGATVVSAAWEIGSSVYWARVVPDYSGSCDAPFVTLAQARKDGDSPIYMTGSSRSIFGLRDLQDVADVISRGYRVYPVEVYEHGQVSIRHLSNRALTAKQILTGSFRQDFSLGCRFDSAFAFVALPKHIKRVTQEALDELSNWCNGEAYGFEILESKAKNQDVANMQVLNITKEEAVEAASWVEGSGIVDAAKNSKKIKYEFGYETEVIDSCWGFLNESHCEEEALGFLRSIASHQEQAVSATSA